MAQILQNKNLATKFQILVEIAANQPNIQQKLIAPKIGITPQAISEYIKKLLKDGFIVSNGRSRYKITKEGVDWIVKMTRELQNYSAYVRKAVTSATVCAAVAEDNLSRGQVTGLKMRDGVLCASEAVGEGAKGIAISDARDGEDVGISNIEGIVDLKIGSITIVKVPGVERGRSSKADLGRLKKVVGGKAFVGAIGLEALSALRKINVDPRYFYGVKEAIVEAAYSGLFPLVVCVDNQLSSLIQRLESENLSYEILDVSTRVD